MEADSPPLDLHPVTVIGPEPKGDNESNPGTKSPNESAKANDAHDDTIHGFNCSNVTVIETKTESDNTKIPHCEGSDSGVEIAENLDSCVYRRDFSSNNGNSQDFENLNSARSCDSSITSVCSNYDEAYNLLVRKNSTLLEDYGRNGDVTSENGSESSSVSGSQRNARRTLVNVQKKKLSSTDSRIKSSLPKERSRSKPPVNPKKPIDPVRLKSVDRLQSRITQASKVSNSKAKARNNLDLLNLPKREAKGPSSAAVRASSGSRTPSTGTPTDDGRWPFVNSKPAPLMARSLKGSLDVPKQRITQMDTKTIEKYATLPRRKKNQCTEILKDAKKPSSRENTVHRIVLGSKKTSSKENVPSKMTNSLYSSRSKQKTKIYHEFSTQTALTMSDVENALSGIAIAPRSPTDVEKCTKGVNVDIDVRENDKLKERLAELHEKFSSLQRAHEMQSEKLKVAEERLVQESSEKESLKEELQNNSQRVLAILGTDVDAKLESSGPNYSLMVLESRFQNASQVVIKQEEEISKLNDICRSLQMELERSLTGQRTLMQHQQDLETESMELQEFMQAEKMTLHDVLKESEAELQKYKAMIAQKDKDLVDKQEEYKQLIRTNEQRRQENLSLQARLRVLESKSRDLLVQQGSSVSGAAVALSALIGRLDGLVEELVEAYSISDQELEDLIFHNEAYKNSSSSHDSTPENSRKLILDKLPSPQKGSSFVSAVINAIKNAAHSPFALRDVSKDNLSTDRSSSNEMLDSETEPCLMMEHVLEDVVIPDGHSQNLISSGHGSLMSSRLTHSESLKDLSNAILNRQSSWSCCESMNTSFTGNMTTLCEFFPTMSLVDQVIDVDNLITRLLKVIRIIQLENDDCMNELQDHRDTLLEQMGKEKETNKVMVKQLKEWEVLGARLKGEVKDLLCQISKKHMEIDNLRSELNKQREEVEKLNQDVCQVSTALAKAELESKTKEEEVHEEIKKWEETGEMPTPEVLERLILNQNQANVLKEKLVEKEKRLTELTQEFVASRQVLTESLKDSLNESKRQYEAIDKALEVLHSIQSVVQQCPPLSKLQRDLEDVNFQSASALPLVTPSDCNANAGLLQAVDITPTINTTA